MFDTANRALVAGANVVYDSLLLDLSTPDTAHTVSAWGIGHGYIAAAFTSLSRSS